MQVPWLFGYATRWVPSTRGKQGAGGGEGGAAFKNKPMGRREPATPAGRGPIRSKQLGHARIGFPEMSFLRT